VTCIQSRSVNILLNLAINRTIRVAVHWRATPTGHYTHIITFLHCCWFGHGTGTANRYVRPDNTAHCYQHYDLSWKYNDQMNMSVGTKQNSSEYRISAYSDIARSESEMLRQRTANGHRNCITSHMRKLVSRN